MLAIKDLKKISDYEWEIPVSYREDMRVPVRIFATRRLLEAMPATNPWNRRSTPPRCRAWWGR